jgi:hypothetical protein
MDSRVKDIIHEKEILCANHLHHRCRPSSVLGGPCHSSCQEGRSVGAPCCNCENDGTKLEYGKCE